MHNYLFAVFLLAVAIDNSEGCSCAMSHRQQQYCGADFVMQVKVQREEIIHKKTEQKVNNETVIQRFPVDRKYLVRIRKIFKVKNNTVGLDDNSTIAELYTPYSDSMCGVTLHTKMKYVIAGQITNGQLTYNMCGWVLPWKQVTKIQKKNLRFLYQPNCGCKIVRDSNQGEERLNKSCKWEGYTPDGDCYDQHSACVIDKNSSTGGCKWHRNKHVKQCRQTLKHRQWNP